MRQLFSLMVPIIKQRILLMHFFNLCIPSLGKIPNTDIAEIDESDANQQMALISHLCQSHLFYSYFMVLCAFISCNQLMSADVTLPLLVGDSETRIKAKTKLCYRYKNCVSRSFPSQGWNLSACLPSCQGHVCSRPSSTNIHQKSKLS